MRRKIILVDDEVDLCRLLTKRLKQEGFQVAAVSSGREALALVEQEPPDLIILELALPGMGGFETLRRLRERAREVKVVVHTAHGTAQHVREAKALGVKEFLGKPFDQDRLLRLVAQVA